MRALQDIAAERRRQVEVEGWTEAHDDSHADGALAKAAGSYAIFTASGNYGTRWAHPIQWPWSPHWFKPKDRRSDLVKAGALVVAEIERLDRKDGPPSLMPTCPFDVVPLIAGALIHDRQHWRDNAACHAENLIRAIDGDGRMHRRPKAPRAALVQELRETASMLRTSFEGDYYPSCEACEQMVYPDDVRFPMSEVDMHARCFGEPNGKPGDQVAVPRDQVEVEDGEAYSGFVTLYAQGPLHSDADLLTIMAKADAFLQARGGQV